MDISNVSAEIGEGDWWLDYQSAEHRFRTIRRYFESHAEAESWGRANLANFHLDMVSAEINTLIKSSEKQV